MEHERRQFLVISSSTRSKRVNASSTCPLLTTLEGVVIKFSLFESRRLRASSLITHLLYTQSIINYRSLVFSKNFRTFFIQVDFVNCTVCMDMYVIISYHDG